MEVINSFSKMKCSRLLFCLCFLAGHFYHWLSVWRHNWQTNDSADSNACRHLYFPAANVLLFTRQCAVEDYKPKAAVCIVFLTISHCAVSAVLLYILTFTLSRSHCIRIYHISEKVAQWQWGKNEPVQQIWMVLMCLQMLGWYKSPSFAVPERILSGLSVLGNLGKKWEWLKVQWQEVRSY